jgi:chaperonin GroES
MEQSSTSKTNEIPKHKNALEEKYKEQPQEKKLVDEKDKLPNPTGWRMIVLPFKMKNKTKGGIVLAETTLEKQQVASQCGLVLRMGPDCYKDKERYADGPWCKEGDWVVFARYAGSRMKIEGGEVRLLNDDEVLATIKNPEDILHEY